MEKLELEKAGNDPAKARRNRFRVLYALSPKSFAAGMFIDAALMEQPYRVAKGLECPCGESLAHRLELQEDHYTVHCFSCHKEYDLRGSGIKFTPESLPDDPEPGPVFLGPNPGYNVAAVLDAIAEGVGTKGNPNASVWVQSVANEKADEAGRRLFCA